MFNLKKTFFLNFFLVFFLFFFQLKTFALSPSFKDVEKTPYLLALEYLFSQGIIHGYPDGTFEPYEDMNRAELTKVAVAAFGLHPDPSIYHDCFLDVTDQWFAPYVCYAKAQGWVQGYSEEKFHPNSDVSSGEALKIILHPLFGHEIARQTPQEMKASLEGYRIELGDWSAPYMAFAFSRNIVGEEDYRRFPSRGEIAEWLFRAKLTKRQGWEFYHPYLRDQFLKEGPLADLVKDAPPCYSLWPGINFEPFNTYLKTQYNLNIPLSNKIKTNRQSEEDFPLFKPGYFCISPEGELIFSNAIVQESEENIFGNRKTEHHFMRFDSAGKLTQNQSFICWEEDPLPLLNVDLPTFERLSCTLAKDKNHVYLGERVLSGLSPQTFQILRAPYTKDDQSIYYSSYYLESTKPIEADFNTFEVIEENGDDGYGEFHYAKDKNHIYFKGKAIEGVDKNSFQVIRAPYSKDAYHIYSGGKVVEGLDPDTFEILSLGNQIDLLTKDKNAVYYRGNTVNLGLLDLSTVEWVEETVLKDANNLYCKIEYAYLPPEFGPMCEPVDKSSLDL